MRVVITLGALAALIAASSFTLVAAAVARSSGKLKDPKGAGAGCSSYTGGGCKACVSAPSGECGYCLATKTCETGSYTGPNEGSCPKGYWEWYLNDCNGPPTPVPTTAAPPPPTTPAPPSPSFAPRTPHPLTPAPTQSHSVMCLENINASQFRCELLGCYFSGGFCWPAVSKTCEGQPFSGCEGGGAGGGGLYCACSDAECGSCKPGPPKCERHYGVGLGKEQCILKGCYWSEEQQWCHLPMAVNCYKYDGDKTSCNAASYLDIAYCAYDETSGKCQGNGNSAPKYVPTPSPGPNRATAPECISILKDEDECVKRSCHWSPNDNGYHDACYPAESENCFLYTTQETCTGSGNPWCGWITRDNICGPSYGLHCYSPFDQDSCEVAGCYWGRKVGKCFNPPAALCHYYGGNYPECIDADHCAYDHQSKECYAKDQGGIGKI